MEGLFDLTPNLKERTFSDKLSTSYFFTHSDSDYDFWSLHAFISTYILHFI